jgi:CHORD/CS domain
MRFSSRVTQIAINTHSRPPIFHEGSKGYTCCKRRVLEFDECDLCSLILIDNRFLKIAGCTISGHRFLSPPSAAETIETVQCREDFYQTQQTCVLAIFARKIDVSTVQVAFSPRELNVSFDFDPHKRYTATIPLYDEIDSNSSRFQVLSMKLEITMKKANGASWPVLRPDPNVTQMIKFGVDSR